MPLDPCQYYDFLRISHVHIRACKETGNLPCIQQIRLWSSEAYSATWTFPRLSVHLACFQSTLYLTIFIFLLCHLLCCHHTHNHPAPKALSSPPPYTATFHWAPRNSCLTINLIHTKYLFFHLLTIKQWFSTADSFAPPPPTGHMAMSGDTGGWRFYWYQVGRGQGRC